jgi:hypothetical protein
MQNGRSVKIAQTIKKAGFHWMILKVMIMSVKLAEMNGDCSRRDQTLCKKIKSLQKKLLLQNFMPSLLGNGNGNRLSISLLQIALQ